MIITAISVVELFVVGCLYLINISSIQKLLNNYERKKYDMILSMICILLGIGSLILRVKDLIAASFICNIVFYTMIFMIQIRNSAESKKKGMYITAMYLISDSILQSLAIIFIKLIFDDYTRAIAIYTASILYGSVIYLIIKKANLTGNQIRNSAALLSSKIYILILLTLFFIGNLCGNMPVDSYETIFSYKINNALTAISILFFLIIMLSFIFKSISNEYYANLSKLMEKAVKQQLKHYDKVSKLNEELREFRHDYKNHMICLQSMMEAKAYQQAEEYIRTITKQEIIEAKNYFSGNRTADAILSDKNESAERAGSYIRFNGCISGEINPADLCTMLSNALDNAIEACERIKSDDTLCISIDCAVIQKVQIIKVSNPNNVDSTVTIKNDKEHHGFGLYNIRKTVEMLDGQMKIPKKIPEFVLELEFPIGNHSL